MHFQEMGFSFPRHQNPFSGSRRSLGSQVSNQPPMVFDPPRPYSPPSLYHTLYLHLYHLYLTLRSLYLHLYVWRQINGPPVNPRKFPTSVPSHILHSPAGRSSSCRSACPELQFVLCVNGSHHFQCLFDRTSCRDY